MSDHSVGAALYSLKAVRAAGGQEGDERIWQTAQLPPEIEGLVVELMATKGQNFNI